MEPGTGRGGTRSIVDTLRAFYAVLVQPQSYLNLVYLLLAFPLGIFYFVFLVTGLSVGVATSIIWVGFVILFLVGGAWFLLAGFERWMATVVLRGAGSGIATDQDATAMPFAQPAPAPSSSPWARLKSHLRNATTWTSLVYLLSKFPLGVVSFCVLVTSLSLSAALAMAPWLYAFGASCFTDLEVGPWAVSSWGAAWLVGAIGLLLVFPASLHIMNALARLSGWWARALLGPRTILVAQR